MAVVVTLNVPPRLAAESPATKPAYVTVSVGSAAPHTLALFSAVTVSVAWCDRQRAIYVGEGKFVAAPPLQVIG